MKVIDCDTHVFESPETWDYLDPTDRQFRPIAAVAGPAGKERKFWLVDGRHWGRGGGEAPGITQEMKELKDIPARVAHMDQLGVDVQVIFPSLFLHVLTPDPAVERALARSYNRWMADVTSDYRDRLRWVVVPPLLSLEAAFKELEYGKEHGAVGVFMRGFEGYHYLNDPYFDPFWAKAEEVDLPICVHAGQGNIALADVQNRNFFTYLVLPIIAAAQQLLLGGIPQRFPGLRFGFFEAGSNWVPFVLQQARKSVTARGKYPWPDDPIRDSRFFVACESDDDLPYVTQFTGPDNLVIGTDYGHTDNAAEIDALKNVRKQEGAGLPPGVVDRILSDNARAFYRL